MCGIVGFTTFQNKHDNEKDILYKMTKELSKRGPDEENYYFSDNVALGHRRLVIVDAENGKQPMCRTFNNSVYTLIYNGQLYNANDIRKQLIEEYNFTFQGYSDTEVILKAYIQWGSSIIHKFNGIFSFAIWDDGKKELFLARDHFGIKPLYYTIINNDIIFASELKAILKYPGINLELDSQGISELFGIGPAHTPGTSIFKNIYELKPAHFAVFNRNGIHITKYWELKSKEHTDSFEQTCKTVKFLLNDAINRQLVSDVPLCCLLSGVLDSSIITAYASNFYKENGLPPLDTYSIDYVDNDKNFVKSDFQPNADKHYINIMKDTFNTNHHEIVIDTPELAKALEDAVIARDFPRYGRCRLFPFIILQICKKRCNSCIISVNVLMKFLVDILGSLEKMH